MGRHFPSPSVYFRVVSTWENVESKNKGEIYEQEVSFIF